MCNIPCCATIHTAISSCWVPGNILRLWCYRNISGIILDHSIFLLWLLDQESRIITRISVFNLPSRIVHQLLTSPSLDLHSNRSMSAIRRSAGKMCIIFRLVLVVGSRLPMVTSYRQETIFLVAKQMTILASSHHSIHLRWDVVNTKPLQHLEICRVIKEISY